MFYMMRWYIIVVVCLSFAVPLSAQTWREILERQQIEFTAPPQRIPVRYAVDAPLLGNGYTGIAIGGDAARQTFYIARNDFWRLKSALDESFPAVLGKIELQIPQLQHATWKVRQHLAEAITSGFFRKGSCALTYSLYVAATRDAMVLELCNNGEDTLQLKCVLLPPGKQEIYVNPPDERAFPDVIEVGQQLGCSTLMRAFREEVDIPTEAVAVMNIVGRQDSVFCLSPAEKQIVVVTFASNFTARHPMAAAIRSARQLTRLGLLERLRQQHLGWWAEYWQKSYISIPLPDLERQYYLSLYGMACCSRQAEFPPSIFGTWITAERPWWNGDYHLNYNHMAPYYALFSANRLEQALPYTYSMLRQRERGCYYAEKVCRIPDGILLPVGVGPLGIETTRLTDWVKQHRPEQIIQEDLQDGGYFWGQKSNSAYAVTNMSMHFYRTWDKAYARLVYPFVKGVATFWKNYLVKEHGRYVIYNDAIHEGSVGDMNSVLSLALVRLVMQTATDMSLLLHRNKQERECWGEIMEHLSGFPTQQRNGKRVFRYAERGTAWWGGNTLGIQPVYPAGQVGRFSDTALLQTALNTVEVMQRWMDSNGANSFFPAAVRVNYPADSILVQLRKYAGATYPNGFRRGNPHGIENLSTVPNTVNEMLCSGHQDRLVLFPCWPREVDAEFHDIRVEGAFLVSANLRDGMVSGVRLVSERGREVYMLNPWPGMQVEINHGKRKIILSGDWLCFPTRKGEKINLVPIDEGKFIEPINGKEVNHEKMYVNHEKMQHEIKREE